MPRKGPFWGCLRAKSRLRCPRFPTRGANRTQIIKRSGEPRCCGEASCRYSMIRIRLFLRGSTTCWPSATALRRRALGATDLRAPTHKTSGRRSSKGGKTRHHVARSAPAGRTCGHPSSPCGSTRSWRGVLNARSDRTAAYSAPGPSRCRKYQRAAAVRLFVAAPSGSPR